MVDVVDGGCGGWWMVGGGCSGWPMADNALEFEMLPAQHFTRQELALGDGLHCINEMKYNF